MSINLANLPVDPRVCPLDTVAFELKLPVEQVNQINDAIGGYW